MTIQTLLTQVTVGGKQIDAKQWECHLGAYGSINTFVVKTSGQDLRQSGINPFNLQDQTPLLPIKIYVILDGAQQLIFTGIVDSCELQAEDDIVEFMGRDNSAILRDTSTKLDKSQYFNQPISNIVQQIATQYGFTPKVTATTQLAGVKYVNNSGEEYAFADRPRPLWNTLQLLTKEAGYILYVNPKNELHFEQPGTSGNSVTATWNDTSLTAAMPIMNLSILKQARRSQSFTVTVFGYDQSAKQAVSATAVVNGGNGPTYYRRYPNLASVDAQAKADAAAADIARKGLIVKATVDGNAALNISDKLTIQESTADDLFGLNNQPMYISGLSHVFAMPGFESTEAEGFFTHITAALAITTGDE